MLNVAESIVLFLSKRGIDTSFGVIGGAIEPITDAVNKFKLKEYYPAHESTCAYAASKYYEYKHKPALVFSTTGAGILNLVNGLGSSFDEKKPLFVIVPQEKLSSHDKGALQSSRQGGVNTLNILKEVTCYCDEIVSPLHLEQKLNLAWFKMQEHQQPVALSIPVDILRTESANVALFPCVKKEINRETIKEISSRDCLLVGEGCKDILFNLVELSKRKNIPILDIPASRGFLPNGLTNYKGMIGLGGNSSATYTLNKANKIYFFYGRITETNIGENNDWLNKTVFISENQSDLYRARKEKYLIENRQLNKMLVDVIGSNANAFDHTNKRISLDLNPNEVINTNILYDYLSETLPVDTHAFFDCGNSFLFGLNRWNVRKSPDNKDKIVNIVMNQASMASAIPLMIGALSVSPEKTYLCVTGDGSFKMGSNELNLLGQFQSNVILVVLNDSVMGMAMHGQRIAGAKATGINNGFTDFSMIAQASGIKSYVINKVEDLINTPLDLDEVILLDVRIDKEIIPPILERMNSLNMNNNRGGKI